MARLRRIVVDPNVFVSAASTVDGAAAVIIDLIDAGIVVPIVSPRSWAELDGVLRRDKFRAWLDLDQVAAFLAELERLAEASEDPEEVPHVSPDPGDDYLVALAYASRADALVSGDRDLSELRLQDMPVLAPRDLLDALAGTLGEGEPRDDGA